jgi:hypothetical protein
LVNNLAAVAHKKHPVVCCSPRFLNEETCPYSRHFVADHDHGQPRCQKTPATSPDIPTCNFYYWKTTLDFSKKDIALADSLGMKKLYLRYFDVDWRPGIFF